VLGGPTTAGMIFTMWGSSLGLATAAALGRPFSGAEPAPVPTLGWGRAVALGAWYASTGGGRLIVILSLGGRLISKSATGAHAVSAIPHMMSSLGGPGLLLLAVPVLLLGPIGEELTFRGLLQPALSGWMKPALSIGITSVVFGAVHWSYGLLALVVVFHGAVFGWAMTVTGRLRAPIVLHMLMNGLTFGWFVIGELRAR
jgi:uncharacterized protein